MTETRVRCPGRLHTSWLVALLLLLPMLPATAQDMQSAGNIADLYVVDCLLPGQVRQLGKRSYLTPRRPTRTTAADCRIRGGEYVAYDRADYRTALNVWLQAAEAGDAEAQATVGEIYEKGLGGEPNYAAAHIWYERAAEQGSTRAQFALGTLYEQGLGVPKDILTALNWYRKAWGISEDNVIFESAASRAAARQREALEAQIAEKSKQVDVLRTRVQELEAKLQADASASAELEVLRNLVSDLESQVESSSASLAELPRARTREPLATDAASFSSEERSRMFRDLNVGNYYALLIGNEEYESIESLNTPLNDIERAAGILRDKYGFDVKVVADGNNVAVMQAINDLNEQLDSDDNLLLFYAGHGARLEAGESEVGYWLPSNAEPPPRDTFWVSNEFITGHLARLEARRVLVVADSCYAGLLSSEPSFLLLGEVEDRYGKPEFLKFKLQKRSRLLLTSGGDRPVLDTGTDGHSVFANAFLDVLENNDELMSAPELFLRIRDQVEEGARSQDFEQSPEFKVIKSAGHEVGDFFFLPLSAR